MRLCSILGGYLVDPKARFMCNSTNSRTVIPWQNPFKTLSHWQRIALHHPTFTCYQKALFRCTNACNWILKGQKTWIGQSLTAIDSWVAPCSSLCLVLVSIHFFPIYNLSLKVFGLQKSLELLKMVPMDCGHNQRGTTEAGKARDPPVLLLKEARNRPRERKCEWTLLIVMHKKECTNPLRFLFARLMFAELIKSFNFYLWKVIS